MGHISTGMEEEEEDLVEFPILFNFYQDKLPFNKLGEIKVNMTYYFENIVVKQLLKEPATDKFAVAFYLEQQDEEPSCTLIFNQGDTATDHGWKYPELYVQKNQANPNAGFVFANEARAEKLINCFHVDTENHGEKFLLFRDETLLVINEND